MKWQNLGRFTLTPDWQYVPFSRGRDYKITYLSSSLKAHSSTGLIALVDAPSEQANSTEIFKPQRINSYQISEIVRFPEPPRGWSYRLAVKQLSSPNQFLPTSEVQIFMPAYLSNPAFSGATTGITNALVATDSTKSVTLSFATVGKIGTTITNRSKVAKLYVSLGSAASLTNYDKILGSGETYESPFNWSGDIFGIWDKADSSTTGNAAIKDFS